MKPPTCLRRARENGRQGRPLLVLLAALAAGCAGPDDMFEDMVAFAGGCRWLEDEDFPERVRPPDGACMRLRVEDSDRRLAPGSVDACEAPPATGVRCMVVAPDTEYSVFARRRSATSSGVYYTERDLEADGSCSLACPGDEPPQVPADDGESVLAFSDRIEVPGEVPGTSDLRWLDGESSVFPGGSTGIRTLDQRIKNPLL